MKLEVLRYSHGKEDTLGLLFVDGKFQCYTLEDEMRTVKVFGKTRIYEGEYEINFRKGGRSHNRYLKKFGAEFHKGMLHLHNVPNFKHILIHIGNDNDDTAGCLLVGDSSTSNIIKKGFIGGSTNAYKMLYEKVAEAIIRGEHVSIKIKSM